LTHIRSEIERGVREAARLTAGAERILHQVHGIEIQYISIVETESLKPADPVAGRVLVAVAARIGSTRLIDNIVVDVG
jgi:pantoate--beta-alanine ligase